jgi:hypothetical protein
VVGPHAPVQKGADSRGRLTGGSAAAAKEQSRTVDVEFTVNPPEPPFGYALNISIMPEYISSREASRRLGISPSVLGMLTGSFVIDPTRTDIGLNLKKNGEFQLLEYARAVVSHGGGNGSGGGGMPEPGKVGGKTSSIWGSGDTVQIVGSVDASGNTGGVSGPGGDGFNSSTGYSSWEYSEKALELIEEYRRQFPIIFINLQSLSHQKKYTAKEVFGASGSGEAEVDKVITWMKNQPFFHLARSPLTSSCISRCVADEYYDENYLATTYILSCLMCYVTQQTIQNHMSCYALLSFHICICLSRNSYSLCATKGWYSRYRASSRCPNQRSGLGGRDWRPSSPEGD